MTIIKRLSLNMNVSPPPLISAYSGGGFTIATEFHQGSVLIIGAENDGFIIQPWDILNPDMITRKSLDAIYNASNRPMLVLLGVGTTLSHPFAKLRAELATEAIGVEIQTTPAACRTWNLLLSEGRKVAFAAITQDRTEQ